MLSVKYPFARGLSLKNLLIQLVANPAGAYAVLAVAALLEVAGDACFQSGLYQSTGGARVAWFAMGALVLATYGLFVNLPHWDFGKLLGVYVALFFVIAQIVAKVRFQQSPTAPILAGGALIVAGGVVITFWKP
jgi:small multidrug resistance family-3 protein